MSTSDPFHEKNERLQAACAGLRAAATKAEAIGEKRPDETMVMWFGDESSDMPWEELASLALPPLHAVDEVGCKREGRKARCFANPNQTVVITSTTYAPG